MGTCLRCNSYTGGCSIHERRMQSEMAKYFRPESYSARIRDSAETESPRQSVADDYALLEDFLASRMYVFARDYATPQCGDGGGGGGEEGEGVILRHGKLDLAFEVDDFITGRGQHARDVRDGYCILGNGGRYFTMGAVLSITGWGYDFCCLFEDGTYFFRDSTKRLRAVGTGKSFGWKLHRLKKLIEASSGGNDDARRCLRRLRIPPLFYKMR